MSKIKFVNHSSFLVETSKNIFLCDPWYEGSAFFNGWNLVSQEINNSAIIKTLSEKKKILIFGTRMNIQIIFL